MRLIQGIRQQISLLDDLRWFLVDPNQETGGAWSEHIMWIEDEMERLKREADTLEDGTHDIFAHLN